jgi:hypothetical protein
MDLKSTFEQFAPMFIVRGFRTTKPVAPTLSIILIFMDICMYVLEILGGISNDLACEKEKGRRSSEGKERRERCKKHEEKLYLISGKKTNQL